MMFADLHIEIIGEIAGKSRSAYHGLVRAYPRFARSLTLGDRLDFAEKFGYDCRVKNWGGMDEEIRWYLCGEYHRTDGPALECATGSKHWYINGILHRIGGPAIEYANGEKNWYFEGKLHRVGGPAIECADGYKAWYINDKPHRVDGPAIECANGSKYWHFEGKLHRVDGPAIEYASGLGAYWIDGGWMSESEFKRATRGKSP